MKRPLERARKIEVLCLSLIFLMLTTMAFCTPAHPVHSEGLNVDLSYKEGVTIKPLTVEMMKGIIFAEEAAAYLGLDLVITSGTDGQHMIGSKHYEGNAVDIRSLWWTEKDRKAFISLLQSTLKDYDIILELTHIHMEYDPKGSIEPK